MNIDSYIITTKQRDNSVDIAKGICMFLVMLFHSEVYFETNIHLQPFFAPFFVTTFFFISGRYIVNHTHPLTFVQKLKRIFSTLLWPYVIFTFIIWLPKAFAHEQVIDIKNMFIDIFGGTASWFVAALIVGEIIFYTLYKFIHNEYILLGCGLVLMTIGLYLKTIDPDPFPWYYKEALINVFYICIGYFFGIHYKKFSKLLSFKNSTIVYIIIYAVIFAIGSIGFLYWSSSVIIYHIYILVLALSGIITVLKISKSIGHMSILEYIGRNSIFYYFLNGGAILISSKILNMMNCPHYYIINVLITVFATAGISIAIWLIDRYAPFLKRFSATW